MSASLAEGERVRRTDHVMRDVLFFYPTFLDRFEVVDHGLAIKTKVTDLSDSRPLLVLRDTSRHERLIQVFSSKLTSIFSAEREVKRLLETRYFH